MGYSAVALKAVQEGIRSGIPEDLSTSQWAEAYRVINRGARKGRWSNATVPFATEIMDAVDDPAVREVVYMKPSQVAGSEIALNILAKRIHLAPTEMIYCAETEDKAKAWTQESFDATVRETEVLRRLIKTADEDNNQRIKRYPGGQLTIVWASSPHQLSSRPVEVLIFDECDAYKPTNEGDAIKLGEARTKTYSGSEKIIKISSPRDAETSEIEKSYLKGDQREYYVPCPSCDEFQTLKWSNVKWDDGEPETAYMVCVACGVMIEDDDKFDMLARGKWIAGKEFNGVASFKINQLYSPFVPWSRMVVDFLEAKKFRSTLQVWTNTALGESWKPEERIEYADLKLNREEYPAPWPSEVDNNYLLVAPPGVLVITAGVDVQGDRLEAYLIGWGKDHESWAIDYRVLFGDPAGMEIWDELSDYLTSHIPGYMVTDDGMESRDFRVSAAGIDTGGHHTQQVYRFCKANANKRWFALKGSSQPGNPLISKPKWVGQNPKVRLFSIGTDTAKDEIFSFLQVEQPGPGFCHFPNDTRFDDAFLKQLCSEKKVAHFRMGRQYHIYEKVSANARNEALDTFVYAIAARAILNPNYEAIARRKIAQAEAADRPVIEIDDDPTPTPEPTPPVKNPYGFKVINNDFAGYRP